VFVDQGTDDVEESQERWNRIKAEEKRSRGLDPDRESVLKDLPASRPCTRPTVTRKTPRA